MCTDLPYFSLSMKAAKKYVLLFSAANFMFSFASTVPVCPLAIVVLGVVAKDWSCREAYTNDSQSADRCSLCTIYGLKKQ